MMQIDPKPLKFPYYKTGLHYSLQKAVTKGMRKLYFFISTYVFNICNAVLSRYIRFNYQVCGTTDTENRTNNYTEQEAITRKV